MMSIKNFHLSPFPVMRKQLCYWTIQQAPTAKVRDRHSSKLNSIQLSLQPLQPSCTSSALSTLARSVTSHPQDSKTYLCQPHREVSKPV